MEFFAITFPLLFIFHDLEEIIGMKRFLNRNADMLQARFPFLYKRFCNFTTEGFALAVMEEFIVFTAIALLAIYFDNSLFWNIWFGGFLGLTIHYVVHIVQALVIRRYIPALITSIICLPISIMILSSQPSEKTVFVRVLHKSHCRQLLQLFFASSKLFINNII